MTCRASSCAPLPLYISTRLCAASRARPRLNLCSPSSALRPSPGLCGCCAWPVGSSTCKPHHGEEVSPFCCCSCVHRPPLKFWGDGVTQHGTRPQYHTIQVLRTKSESQVHVLVSTPQSRRQRMWATEPPRQACCSSSKCTPCMLLKQ